MSRGVRKTVGQTKVVRRLVRAGQNLQVAPGVIIELVEAADYAMENRTECHARMVLRTDKSGVAVFKNGSRFRPGQQFRTTPALPIRVQLSDEEEKVFVFEPTRVGDERAVIFCDR